MNLGSCFVLFLAAFIASVDGFIKPEAVQVELYYEALCPDCQQFFKQQFYPTWKKLENTGILTVNMFPYGNARETFAPDGSWKFICQHGPPECYGNKLEICVEVELNYNATKFFPVIECIEASGDPIKAAKECVEQRSDATFEAVDKCAKGKRGMELMHAMHLVTRFLNPPHTYVPWVTVDRKHTEEMQAQAENDLLKLVCEKYKGPLPQVCKEHLGFWESLWHRITIDIV